MADRSARSRVSGHAATIHGLKTETGVQRFIVAEVSKTWPEHTSDMPRFVSQDFESIINVNLERGYRLHSWQLHRVMVSPEVMNETIVAVFEAAGTIAVDDAKARSGVDLRELEP